MVKVSKFIHKKDFFQFTYIRFGYTEGQEPGQVSGIRKWQSAKFTEQKKRIFVLQ